eukprot:CAMPEP_0116843354 /NCGR_PEP_ID=MMETSP0418-20121206/12039_1 /TAXON_ID=1158023 /ORGANISM="Astrosyne radiata, Strain 13vi08-1A" /LENGTH=170 /DNA_ID=CAMNT_0004474093 /DNA_START=255 /DNA_END=767 /DNA_ORIENTATION=+
MMLIRFFQQLGGRHWGLAMGIVLLLSSLFLMMVSKDSFYSNRHYRLRQLADTAAAEGETDRPFEILHNDDERRRIIKTHHDVQEEENAGARELENVKNQEAETLTRLEATKVHEEETESRLEAIKTELAATRMQLVHTKTQEAEAISQLVKAIHQQQEQQQSDSVNDSNK